MADTVTINGVVHDWESTSITGPQGVLVGITDLNWKASRKKSRVYGKGSAPRGVTRGQYEATWDMTLSVDEFTSLTDAAGGSLLDNPFDLSVVQEPPEGQAHEVALKDCRTDDIDEGVKQGDEENMIKLSGSAGMIERDGIADYEE